MIEQITRQKLPEGFQTAEFLLAHGMIDMIVPRAELATTLATLVRHYARLPATRRKTPHRRFADAPRTSRGRQ